MKTSKETYPGCFGELETVFPKEANGLRNTPNTCHPCPHKIDCLKVAVSGSGGRIVQGEMIDRAYASGRMTFWQRWSRKKALIKRKSK